MTIVIVKTNIFKTIVFKSKYTKGENHEFNSSETSV